MFANLAGGQRLVSGSEAGLVLRRPVHQPGGPAGRPGRDGGGSPLYWGRGSALHQSSPPYHAPSLLHTPGSRFRTPGPKNYIVITYRESQILCQVKEGSGYFRFSIRLEDIFGFATDYLRVMYGFTHTLTLIRNLNYKDVFFGAAGTVEGKVIFSKISWIVPIIEPSQVAGYELVKMINDQQTLAIDFRVRQCITTMVPKIDTFTWRLGIRTSPEKPRYLILGFQSDREGSLQKNLGLFDNCHLKNTYVLLNNHRYPAVDYQVDFKKNQYNCLYREFHQFLEKYHGINASVTQTSVDPVAFKHLYPLIVFDVSRQSERISSAIVDITIQCNFHANVADNTKAYCLVISDRRLKFKSDGSKASIVY